MTPISKDGAPCLSVDGSADRSQTASPVTGWSVRPQSSAAAKAGRRRVGARRAAIAWALGLAVARRRGPAPCWRHVRDLFAPIMLALAPYAAAAFVVGLGATSIARRCVRASSVRAACCAPSLDALESRLRGCASGDIVLLIDFDRTITDGTSAQCHDVVGATECMPLRVREGFAKMLDFSQPFPPELEVGLQQLQPALTLSGSADPQRRHTGTLSLTLATALARATCGGRPGTRCCSPRLVRC